jgi:hypothetical protein
MQETQPLYCWESVITAPLHRNGSYYIVACVLVAAGMCLPSRCLVMNIYSDFTIPAFGHRVTIRTSFIQHVPYLICISQSIFMGTPFYDSCKLNQLEAPTGVCTNERRALASLRFITPVTTYSANCGNSSFSD